MALFPFDLIFYDDKRSVTFASSQISIEEKNKIKEILDWLSENNIEYKQKNHICNLDIIKFKNKEDYIAFKLRWM